MRVFLTGATGYIGGALAIQLAEAGHHVRGLSRSRDSFGALRELGVDPVHGTLDDAAVLTGEAHAADAVINAADSDHAAAAATLTRALTGSGKPFLHTSGSSIVGEASNGEIQQQIYTETDVAPGSAWTPAPEKAARVAIDRAILAAADDQVRTVVLCNTMIYGTGPGLHSDSVQLPRLIRTARKTGTAQHIGAGRNIWSNVHLDDVCDLYLRALRDPHPGAFYFVENGEASFADITTAIATALHLGQPQPIDIGAAITEWGYEPAVYALGSNSRVRSAAARADLGWAPKHTSVIDWILDHTRP